MPSRQEKNDKKARQRQRASVSHAQEKADFFFKFGIALTVGAFVVSVGVILQMLFIGFGWPHVVLILVAVLCAVCAFAMFKNGGLWQLEADYEEGMHLYDQTSVL